MCDKLNTYKHKYFANRIYLVDKLFVESNIRLKRFQPCLYPIVEMYLSQEAACRQEQLKQVHSKRESADNERTQHLTEQKELDRLAEEYLKGEDDKEQAKRKQMVAYRQELESQQLEMSETREAAEKREIMQADRNAIFVNTKRDMVVKRKAKEKELLGQNSILCIVHTTPLLVVGLL